jgi:hypothetical protein
MSTKAPDNKHLHLFISICQFYMQLFEEAEDSAMRGPVNSLQNRILFHIAHRRGDESKLMQHHQKLADSQEDQLCLASIHYLRSHFQEVRLPVVRCAPVYLVFSVCAAGNGYLQATAS